MNILFCTLFFVALNSSQSSPVNQEHAKTEISESIETTTGSQDNEIIIKNPLHQEQRDENNFKSSEQIYDETPLKQPTLEILEKVPIVPNYYYPLATYAMFPYDWNDPLSRNVYQMDLQYPGLNNVMYRYDAAPYPIMYPDLYSTFYNNAPTVSYLPPVKTSVPKSAPLSEVNHPMPMLRRKVRSHSKEEDDFLAALSHMAIMNNIIPTMPILRSTNPDYISYRDQIAVFPRRTSGCAIPVLMSCSPMISRSIVTTPYTKSRGYEKHSESKDKKIDTNKKKVTESEHSSAINAVESSKTVTKDKENESRDVKIKKGSITEAKSVKGSPKTKMTT